MAHSLFKSNYAQDLNAKHYNTAIEKGVEDGCFSKDGVFWKLNPERKKAAEARVAKWMGGAAMKSPPKTISKKSTAARKSKAVLDMASPKASPKPSPKAPPAEEEEEEMEPEGEATPIDAAVDEVEQEAEKDKEAGEVWY